MTIELQTHAAVERADAERERIEEKAKAFGKFAERVGAISASGSLSNQQSAGSGLAGSQSVGSGLVGNQSGGSGLTGHQSAGSMSPTRQSAGNTLTSGTSASAGGPEAVREEFRETVAPYADADSMQEALADELSPDLAAALAPAAGGFASALREQLVTRAEERASECRLLAAGIETECDRLQEIASDLSDMTDWLAEADETPLLQLGFEELRGRHDRLAEERATCDELARKRQATFDGTQRDGLTGIRETELRNHLYAEFESDHPVLADLARLDDLLVDCQRPVREHLCARV